MSLGTHEKPPHAILFEMLFGAWTAKILAEVVRLDVPDALVDGPMTADELVRTAGIRAHPVALHRALRACAALGIVTEDSVGRFGPTRLSALLTRDTPGTLKRFVEYSGGTLWKVWSGLAEGLATGASQARAQLGMEFFDYLQANPQALEEFGETLKAHSAVANRGVIERYDFGGIRTLVDVGAGYGPLTMAVLEKYPDIRGVVFDLPEVIDAAPSQLPVKNESVARRLSYVAGDMFKDVPPADAFALKLILHDWDDAQCATILANVCARLERGGRVISIDNVMPPLGDASDVPQKLLDVNMMLLLPGKERTRVEWEALYRGAGLAITAMVPVPDAFNMFVIEGRRVDER
ncbi:MAG TPA: methyltransferase [Gammaproteobacteria bacterium]|nr:methyltransferase [Gammaproteobacteria bacterium]